MKTSIADWFLKPTKQSLTTISVIMFVALICGVLAETNGFTESLFQSKYWEPNLIFLFGILNILRTFLVYFKNKRRITH